MKNSSTAWAAVLAMLATGCHTDKESAYPTPTPFVLTVPSYAPQQRNLNSANPTTNEGVALGRMLFFDKALSLNGQVACASCHLPSHGFADTSALSKGIGGQAGKRNAMALANLIWQSSYFWDGSEKTLEGQVLHPLLATDEMAGSETVLTKALAANTTYGDAFGRAFGNQPVTLHLVSLGLGQYLTTLTSYNAPYDRYLNGEQALTDQEMRGLRLFFTHPDPRAGVRGGNCGDCHQPITTGGVYAGFEGFKVNGVQGSTITDGGLGNVTGKPEDEGKFKVVSLRNIALTAPYMHDGSKKTLQEVLDHYNSETLLQATNVDVLIKAGSNERFGTSLLLTQQEKDDIIAFLHTLTDTTFSKK